jgi:murein DD-endopeptidase MepM/ murein hydrolase activator NlpD
MTHVLAAKMPLFRDRDLFIHDGSRLRRFRVSAPFQAALFAMALVLIVWASFATIRFFTAPQGVGSLTAATEARARQIEQRQALMEAALSGHRIDPSLVAAAGLDGDVVRDGPLAELEKQQLQQAALIAEALDVRYKVTAAELKRLGINPNRVEGGAVGGPFEKAGNATFKALFNSWKKLDQLQDGVIAVPSDKPIPSGVEFTSGYGVRSDPFGRGRAMHAGIDLSGPQGTPIYATADGTVSEAAWNSGGYGNLVKIDHGRGIETRYGHMSKMTVRAGERVTRGQLIGRMGSTGRSTGSHLHYEVRIDGRAVNPIPFMKSTDYVLAMQRRSNAMPMEALGLGGPEGKKR